MTGFLSLARRLYSNSKKKERKKSGIWTSSLTKSSWGLFVNGGLAHLFDLPIVQTIVRRVSPPLKLQKSAGKSNLERWRGNHHKRIFEQMIWVLCSIVLWACGMRNSHRASPKSPPKATRGPAVWNTWDLKRELDWSGCSKPHSTLFIKMQPSPWATHQLMETLGSASQLIAIPQSCHQASVGH